MLNTCVSADNPLRRFHSMSSDWKFDVGFCAPVVPDTGAANGGFFEGLEGADSLLRRFSACPLFGPDAGAAGGFLEGRELTESVLARDSCCPLFAFAATTTA
jgi:hypothetical protein